MDIAQNLLLSTTPTEISTDQIPLAITTTNQRQQLQHQPPLTNQQQQLQHQPPLTNQQQQHETAFTSLESKNTTQVVIDITTSPVSPVPLKWYCYLCDKQLASYQSFYNHKTNSKQHKSNQ